METSNRNYISGGILIMLGVIFLGREFGWFDIDWQRLFKLWPLFLIGAGISQLIGRGRGIGGIIALLGIFLIGSFFYMIQPTKEKGFSWNQNFGSSDDDDDDDNDDENSEKINPDAETKTEMEIARSFSEDMEPSIKTGSLEIDGGVTGFTIEGETNKLFEAETKSNIVDYNLQKVISGGKAKIAFNAKNRNDDNIKIDLGENEFKNDAKIKLNSSIPWDLDMDLGASGADLNLSTIMLKELKIKSGLSGINLKLGDKQNLCNVKIDSGLAGIDIEVPSGVSVKVISNSVLGVNDLDGFTKKDGVYYSENFNPKAKVIVIEYDGALSAIQVNRY